MQYVVTQCCLSLILDEHVALPSLSQAPNLPAPLELSTVGPNIPTVPVHRQYPDLSTNEKAHVSIFLRQALTPAPFTTEQKPT